MSRTYHITFGVKNLWRVRCARVRVLPAEAMRHARLPMEFPTRTVGLLITSLMKSTSCCHNRTINETVCEHSMK